MDYLYLPFGGPQQPVDHLYLPIGAPRQSVDHLYLPTGVPWQPMDRLYFPTGASWQLVKFWIGVYWSLEGYLCTYLHGWYDPVVSKLRICTDAHMNCQQIIIRAGSSAQARYKGLS